MSIVKKSVILISFILIIDQTLKIWTKTHIPLIDTRHVIGNWFLLRFIENPGMAFGISLPGKGGKLFLTLLRILAIGAIGYYLYRLIKRGAPQGLILCLSLILAGAMGNIIDSIFYGVIFSESTPNQVAQMFPEGGGYAPLFYGHVVDMLYFPIKEGRYPQWWPDWSWLPRRFPNPGDSYVFFRPIFNIADSAISTGVITILVFQRRFFKG
jgi:signal peptidase II